MNETLADPRGDFGDEPAYTPEGEPELELGFYVEQLYQPLHAEEPLPVVYGLQGGTWTMPAVRIRGIDVEAALEVRLATVENEVLGEVRTDTRFVLATDGWLEVQALPIPVERQDPEGGEISELYGVSATIDVQVADEEGRSAQVTLPVILSEG